MKCCALRTSGTGEGPLLALVDDSSWPAAGGLEIRLIVGKGHIPAERILLSDDRCVAVTGH